MRRWRRSAMAASGAAGRSGAMDAALREGYATEAADAKARPAPSQTRGRQEEQLRLGLVALFRQHGKMPATATMASGAGFALHYNTSWRRTTVISATAAIRRGQFWYASRPDRAAQAGQVDAFSHDGLRWSDRQADRPKHHVKKRFKTIRGERQRTMRAPAVGGAAGSENRAGRDYERPGARRGSPTRRSVRHRAGAQPRQ